VVSGKPIVVVGSINLDLVALARTIPAVGETVVGTDFQTHPGGKGANQAVAIARLGHRVQMIGKVGRDAFGAELENHLASAGVGLDGVGRHEGASGTALIVVSARGDNSIVVVPGANAAVDSAYVDEHIALIRGAALVLTQLEIPPETVEHLAAVCARENVPLIVDPAPALALPASVFRAAAWFTPNETEAAFYAPSKATEDETARALLDMGCRGVVLKLGARGAYVASSDGGHLTPAFAVEAVDTTAAGDAFNGAFAVGLANGSSPRESATFASAVAAISVTRRGAQPSMPTLEETEAFMAEHAAPLPTILAKK
jgi:ribokinase